MDLKQMKMFVTLADELHFGRAAMRLGVTQSALSQQLQRLEQSLGAQLVTRTSREVSLTEAGELFLQPARESLTTATRARTAVQDFKDGRAGRLVIGSLGAGLNGPLPTILRRFREVAPDAAIELNHLGDSASQERALLTGKLDGAVLRRVVNQRTIYSLRLVTEGFVVYLPSGHRLESEDVISLRQLVDEDFVMWPRALGATFYDLIIDHCRAQGFDPRIAAIGDTLEAQLALVAAGIGLTVQAASNASIARSGTVTVPIRGEELEVPLWFAYRNWQHSAIVDRFLEVVRETTMTARTMQASQAGGAWQDSVRT